MASGWFVKQADKTFGPFDAAQMRKLVVSQKITPKTHVRQGDTGVWVLAENVKGLFSADGNNVEARTPDANQTQALAAAPARPPLATPAPNASATRKSNKAGGAIAYGLASLCLASLAALLCFIPSLRLVGLVASFLGLVAGIGGFVVNAAASALPRFTALGGAATSSLMALIGVVLLLTSGGSKSTHSSTSREIAAKTNAEDTTAAQSTETKQPEKQPAESVGPQGGTSSIEPEAAAASVKAEPDGNHVAAPAEARKKASDDDPYGWQGAEFGMTEDEVRKAIGERATTVDTATDWGDRYAPMTVQDIQLGGEAYVAHLQFGKATKKLEQVLIRETGGADEGKYLSVVKLMTKKYGPPAETTHNDSKHVAIWTFPRMEIEVSLQRLPGFTIIAIRYCPASGKATTNVDENL
jgi:hypothetical protein